MVKKSIYKLLFLFIALVSGYSSKATHLVGGEMSYKCLGGNQYEITLTIFRDDFYGQAQLDDPAMVTVFNATTFAKVNLNNGEPNPFPIYSPASTILPTNTNSCISNPPRDVRIQKGVYTKILTLPASTSGYILVYQRCCRNDAVLNLLSNQGSTYQITIPPNITCNSSPIFTNQPPLFLCNNSKLDFDMSATDVNGDQLRYSLCAPLQGLDSDNPTVCQQSQPGCAYYQATSPPFDSVIYGGFYESQKPLGLNSILYINPTSGMLTAIPRTLGLFVVGICVEEIRGGVVINKSIRDFQFNVENCTIPSAAPLVITDNTNSSAIKVNDSTYSNCQGAVVRFDNELNQSGVTYFWDFGVPSRTDDTSILKNPTFAYPDTGIYYATLIVNKGKPCNDTSRIKVIYYPGLVPNFTYVPRCQNQLIQFTDSSTSPYNDVNNWKWVLSAGDTSYVKNPTKLFTTPGTYNVQLTATTAKGCVGKVTKPVVVNPKPTANFTSANLCYKRSTLFTDASTGTISNYFWNFGDGKTDTLKNPTHVFNQFDSFNVQHIVTSPFGCKDTITKKIKMDDTVRLSYAIAPANLCEKAPVTFTNTSTGGNPTAFQWIINNGTPINGNTATATFPSSGTFSVLLISTNRCGKDTLFSSITIQPNPTVNVGTDVTVCNKSTKQLTAIGAFDSLRWSTAENTSNIAVDGTKSPIYISVYKNGCVGKDTVLIKKQTITPNFSNNYLCLNKAITFVNTSTVNSGTLVQYDWKYGDGQSDLNTQNPTHTFSPFANYSVQLIATSDIGCKDTVTKILPMDTVQQVNFKSTELITCQRNQITFQNLTTGGVNNTYTWTAENTTHATKDLNYAFQGTGIYPVKLVVKNRCYADSITKSFVIRPRPNVYIGRDTVLCKNQSATFTVNPSLYDSIRWSTGSTASTINNDGTFNPLKIFVYVDGCVAIDTANVAAQRMNLNFTNDFLCLNRPIIFNNTSTINFGSITNYTWNFGDNTTDIVKSPTHSYSVFGTKNVTLVAKSNAGCFDTLRKTINMDDTVLLAINPIPTDVCFGKTAQYANLSFGGTNTQYVWTLNNINPQTTNTATYSYFVAGTQILKLTATNRCGADSIKYRFEVKPLPKIKLGEDSIIMCPGEQRVLSLKVPFDSVFWSTGDVNKDSIFINGTVSPIKVEVYKAGCLQKDSIIVSTNCDIFIPSAFSPNNDGINDNLNMINKSIKTYNLKIFDRWGALVFETDNLANGWDGTYKGAECQIDSYIYVVSGVKYNNEPFYLKGVVTLLR